MADNDPLLADGSVPVSSNFNPDPNDPANARKVVFVQLASTMIGEKIPPFKVDPVRVVDFVIPDGVVNQETKMILNLEGTPPFGAILQIPPELDRLVFIADLPGGSKQLRMLAPFEGAVTDVVKTIGLKVWNANPTTDESHYVGATATWTVHPASIDAGWGTTPNAFPAAVVQQPYRFYATGVTGTPPYTVRLIPGGGVTDAMLQAAGISISSGTIADTTTDPIVTGSPVVGSEGVALALPITLGIKGATGVEAQLVFPAGFTINRPPGLTLTQLDTITLAAGSINFADYMVGWPTPHISLKAGETLPTHFSLDDDVLSWSGLSTLDNAATSVTFVIANGLFSPTENTQQIIVNIPATGDLLNAAPGSIVSFSKNARGNAGVLLETATNGLELVSISDIASGTQILNTADGAGATHLGAIWNATDKCWTFRNGTGEANRQSLGFLYPFGIGPKWCVLRVRMPDTQEAGEGNLCVFGPSWLGFQKDAGGGGLDLFKLHTANAVLSSPAIDAIGNFVNLLIYVIDNDHAGIAYGTGATITGDTGSTNVAGIDSSWDRVVFSPSYMLAADTDQQCLALGRGLLG